MHRKYQVKSSKWCLFILLAEVGSQGRSYALQELKRKDFEDASTSYSERTAALHQTPKTTEKFQADGITSF